MDDQGSKTVDEEVDKENGEAVKSCKMSQKMHGINAEKIFPMDTNIYAFGHFLQWFFRKTSDILQPLAGESDKLLPWLVHFFCRHCQ